MTQPRTIIHCEQDTLKRHPKVLKTSYPVITLGDLHANTLKLLHFLLKKGIVYWPSNEGSEPEHLYQEFYHAYHGAFNRENFLKLKQLIDTLHIDPNAPLIHFIGDELQDRGRNDLATLYLLAHLRKHGVQYDSCFSNHLYAFLKEFIARLIHQRIGYRSENNILFKSHLALYHNIAYGYISETEVIDLVDAHLKRVRLISYGLFDNGICQYTHAPVSYTIAQHVAKKLNLFYIENTPRFKAWSITQINQKCQQLLSQKDLAQLFHEEIVNGFYQGRTYSELDYPVENLILNRNYTNLTRPEYHPAYQYKQDSAHGHDANDDASEKTSSIASLDALFGKDEQQCEIEYNPILQSRESQLRAQERLSVEEEIKQFIRQDIRQTIAQRNISQLDNTQITDKITYYTPLLTDLTFAAIHADILSLIIAKYHALDQYINSMSMLQKLINELTRHRQHLESMNISYLALNILLEQWEKAQRYLNPIASIDFNSCISITLEQGFDPSLLSLLSSLQAVFNDTKQPLSYFVSQLEKPPQTLLIDAINKNAQFILNNFSTHAHTAPALTNLVQKLKLPCTPNVLTELTREIETHTKLENYHMKAVQGFERLQQKNQLTALQPVLKAIIRCAADKSQMPCVRWQIITQQYFKIIHRLCEPELKQLHEQMNKASLESLCLWDLEQLQTRIQQLQVLDCFKHDCTTSINTLHQRASKLATRFKPYEHLRKQLLQRCHTYKDFLVKQPHHISSLPELEMIQDLIDCIDNKEIYTITNLSQFATLFHQTHTRIQHTQIKTKPSAQVPWYSFCYHASTQQPSTSEQFVRDVHQLLAPFASIRPQSIVAASLPLTLNH